MICESKNALAQESWAAIHLSPEQARHVGMEDILGEKENEEFNEINRAMIFLESNNQPQGMAAANEQSNTKPTHQLQASSIRRRRRRRRRDRSKILDPSSGTAP